VGSARLDVNGRDGGHGAPSAALPLNARNEENCGHPCPLSGLQHAYPRGLSVSL